MKKPLCAAPLSEETFQLANVYLFEGLIQHFISSTDSNFSQQCPKF